jgi:hypothetical protein
MNHPQEEVTITAVTCAGLLLIIISAIFKHFT